MNTLQEGFDSYLAMLRGCGASEEQIKEVTKALFAGAAVMLNILERVSYPDISEDAAVGIVEGCHQEVRTYVTGLAARDGEKPHG